MDYQSLNQKTVVELRSLAKEMGVRIPAGTNKRTLIDMLMEAEKAGKGVQTGQASAAKQGDGGEKPAPRRGRPRRAASDDRGTKKNQDAAAQAMPEPRQSAAKNGRQSVNPPKAEAPKRETAKTEIPNAEAPKAGEPQTAKLEDLSYYRKNNKA